MIIFLRSGVESHEFDARVSLLCILTTIICPRFGKACLYNGKKNKRLQ